MRPVRLGAAMALVCLATVGCSDGDGEAAAAAASTTAAAVEPVSELPLHDDVVLRFTGRVGLTNDGPTLAVSLDQLQALSAGMLRAREPFEDRDIDFEGVTIADLFEAIGVPVSEGQVTFHALDEYTVEFDLAELLGSGAFLAVRADGADMTIAEAGPTRLVFPDDSDLGRNRDLWIWSIDRITIT